jgi:hypothetical protein
LILAGLEQLFVFRPLSEITQRASGGGVDAEHLHRVAENPKDEAMGMEQALTQFEFRGD